MNTTQQPEALRLAELCDNFQKLEKIGTELRRQHARIAELEGLGGGLKFGDVEVELVEAESPGDLVRSIRDYLGVHDGIKLGGHAMDDMALDLARIALRFQHLVAPPADPMDWPLPCDVTVGHGTMRKGVALRTLVLRMKGLYEMATGQNADEVAARTPEQRAELLSAFQAKIAPQAVQAAEPETREALAKRLIADVQVADTIATSACQRVAELPDRDSPADWPESMLVTGDELHMIVREAVIEAQSAPAHPAEGVPSHYRNALPPYGVVSAEEHRAETEHAKHYGLEHLVPRRTPLYTNPTQQGLEQFIERVGDVHFQRCRVGSKEGETRWDIEVGNYGAEVRGKTLREAITKTIAAQAKRGGEA